MDAGWLLLITVVVVIAVIWLTRNTEASQVNEVERPPLPPVVDPPPEPVLDPPPPPVDETIFDEIEDELPPLEPVEEPEPIPLPDPVPEPVPMPIVPDPVEPQEKRKPELAEVNENTSFGFSDDGGDSGGSDD